METRDAIRSVVENIPGICQLKPEQEECLVHILNEVMLWPYSRQIFGKSLIYQPLPIVSEKQVSVSFPCCNLAIKLQLFRQTRNERRAAINRTNPNFDSWLQIFSCLSLLSNISLDALIAPWMRRFTSHNLRKSFTAIFSPVFHSNGFVFAVYLCLQRKFEAAELAHNICHNQTFYDWLTGTPMILNVRQPPPPQRESKRLSIMPFQTLSTKQSEVLPGKGN